MSAMRVPRDGWRLVRVMPFSLLTLATQDGALFVAMHFETSTEWTFTVEGKGSFIIAEIMIDSFFDSDQTFSADDVVGLCTLSGLRAEGVARRALSPAMNRWPQKVAFP